MVEIRSGSYCRSYLTCASNTVWESPRVVTFPVTINIWVLRCSPMTGLRPDNRQTAIRLPVQARNLYFHPNLLRATQPRRNAAVAWRRPLTPTQFRVQGKWNYTYPTPPYAFMECTATAFFLCMFELRLHTLRWQQNIQTSQKSQPISKFRPFDVQVGLLRH